MATFGRYERDDRSVRIVLAVVEVPFGVRYHSDPLAVGSDSQELGGSEAAVGVPHGSRDDPSLTGRHVECGDDDALDNDHVAGGQPHELATVAGVAPDEVSSLAVPVDRVQRTGVRLSHARRVSDGRTIGGPRCRDIRCGREHPATMTIDAD
jgi:hypothetical protein